MASLLDIHIRNTLAAHFETDEFKALMRRAVTWAIQGFERGYGLDERKAFTATVARRIRTKARRPIYLFGRRIWRARMKWADCNAEADRIVTDFLCDERIKFGDPRYAWDDGSDLADAEMEYWEGCP